MTIEVYYFPQMRRVNFSFVLMISTKTSCDNFVHTKPDLLYENVLQNSYTMNVLMLYIPMWTE